MKKISIIIVSWKVRELLKKCLASIEKNGADLDLEILVVDNASADGTVEMVRQEFPAVKLIPSEKNLGFAAGNNLAIKQATGDFILLLNPDTEILPGALENSMAFMASHLEAGIMGPRILNPDKSLQSSVRRFPTLWPIFLMLIKAPKVFPHLKSMAKYLATDFDYTKEGRVDQVMGAYMFIRREVFDKIGLLDEGFFLWFEEVDFCRRASEAGYQIYYSPSAQIIHHGGQSFGQAQLVKKQWIFFKSAARYFKKHGYISRKSKVESP